MGGSLPGAAGELRLLSSGGMTVQQNVRVGADGGTGLLVIAPGSSLTLGGTMTVGGAATGAGAVVVNGAIRRNGRQVQIVTLDHGTVRGTGTIAAGG